MDRRGVGRGVDRDRAAGRDTPRASARDRPGPSRRGVDAVVSGRERATRAAARLGAAWGLGHAVTLVAFGVPILLAERYLPDLVQRGAETTVAALIAFLAVRLLVRWRHGAFASRPAADGAHHHAARTTAGAFGIGLVHGMGGSAGVGVLLLAAIPSRTLALVALVVLAVFTAVSMTVVTTGFGAAVSARRVSGAGATAAPALALSSLAFGLWYAAAAWSLAPYPF